MDRAHLDTPLEIKIEISKKTFFRVRKGGGAGPLKLNVTQTIQNRIDANKT